MSLLAPASRPSATGRSVSASPASKAGLRHSRRPRRVWLIALLLLPLSWLGVRWASFRTEVEIVATETETIFRVNGQTATFPGALPALRELTIRARDSIFPPGGDSLRIDSGEGTPPLVIALPPRFTIPASQPPRPPAGDWWLDDGLPAAVVWRQPLALRPPFRLQATFHGRAFQEIGIVLHGESDPASAESPPPWRFEFRSGLLNNDFFIVQGPRLLAGDSLAPDGARHWRQLCEWPLRGLFTGCELVLVGTLLVWLSGALRTRREGTKNSPTANESVAVRRSWLGWEILALAVLACAGFLLAAWTARDVLERLPHFQDDFSYLQRARWLVAGHLDQPAPPAELQSHFDLPFLFFVNDRWLSQYPIGWPALLAVGVALGAPWLVAPVCGVLTIIFTVLLGRAVGGERSSVGWMAGTCLVLSPLSTLLSASLLSHGAAAAALAGFVWLLVRGGTDLRRPALLAGAGCLLGFAFCMRPLTAAAVALPAGLWLLSEATAVRWPARTWRAGGALLAGGVLGALPALLDNWAVTGSPLTFAYKICADEGWSLHAALPKSLLYADTTTPLIAPMAFGWGWPFVRGEAWLALPFGFAAVPFLTGRATRFDALLLGIFIVLPLAYLGYNGSGAHGFGPRYYADAFFALFVLVARGFQELGRLGRTPSANAFLRLAFAVVFVGLSASAAFTLPGRLRLYRGYNDSDQTWAEELAKLPPRALVLLQGEGLGDWLRVAPLVQTDFTADRIFARSIGDNVTLRRAFPDRPVFVLYEGKLRPCEPSP